MQQTEVLTKNSLVQFKPTKSLRADKNQPRQTIKEDDVEELAATYREHGIINPIEIDDSGMIITGQLRFEAAKEAGLKEVPVRIMDIPKEKRVWRQLTENLQQKSMTAWDIAQTIKRIIKTEKLSQQEISKRLGKDISWASQLLKIFEVPRKLQDAIKKGKIPYSYAPVVASTSGSWQDKMTQKVISGEIGDNDIVGVINRHIKIHPGLAKEIMKIDYRGRSLLQVEDELRKLAPTISEQIEKNFTKTKIITSLASRLWAALEECDKDEIPLREKSSIIDSLHDLQEQIKEFLEKIK